MRILDRPHFRVKAADLADWIESRPDRWWSVDGDPRLTSVVDFPCPSDELAAALRREGKDLMLEDASAIGAGEAEIVDSSRLEQLAVASDPPRKVLRLAWEDADEVWLLLDDEPLA